MGIGIPKYRKYREIPKFNSIEYRKCSIPKFQYYWIPKKIQYWSSIILKFSILVLKIPNFQTTWIMRIIFCKNWKTDFFSNFFQDFQYSSVFLVFFGRFRDSILKKFHIEKKIPKEKIQVFSIFTGFWCFFGTFSISGLLKIWVIPFNSIEYWKCSIPKFQYYWIPKKIPILKFNNNEKKFQYFSPPYP